jgi:photosystem II stability/assembly factor-like uncharacterized protein
VDPLDDDDDSLLREHFTALATDTLSRLRPAGALAAKRSHAQHRRRRALVAVAAAVLALAGAGGGYLLSGGSGPTPDVPLATTGTAVPPSRSGGGVNQASGPGVAIGPAPATSTRAPATPGPAGGPVPPGFRAESITFISTNTAWVLGYAPCLVPQDWGECPAVLRSRDGGRTWAGVPVPGDAAFVGDIRFANLRDGWIVIRAPLVAKDPGGVSGVLYSTHDGGSTWHRVTSVPAAAQVEAAAGRVWVTAGPATGTVPGTPSATPSGAATAPAAGRADAVYSAATGSDSFTRVADWAGTGLVVQGHYAYAYGGDELLSMRDGGQVGRRGLPCATGYQSSAVLAAAAEQSLAVVCAGPPAGMAQPKRAYTSGDGGATWTAGGTPDPGGYVSSLAETGSAVFLAGQQMPVRVSRDSGTSWAAVLDPPSPDGFGYVGFTDDNHGVALAFGASPAIYLSSDAGRTWIAHRFD